MERDHGDVDCLQLSLRQADMPHVQQSVVRHQQWPPEAELGRKRSQPVEGAGAKHHPRAELYIERGQPLTFG